MSYEVESIERGEEVKERRGEGRKLTANDDDCSQYCRTHICGVEGMRWMSREVERQRKSK